MWSLQLCWFRPLHSTVTGFHGHVTLEETQSLNWIGWSDSIILFKGYVLLIMKAGASSSPASAWGSVLSTQVTVLLQVMGFFFPWFSFGILPKRSDPGAVSSLKVAGGAWSAAAEGKQEPDSWLSRWIQSRWPRSVGGKGPYSAGGCSAWGAWSQDLSPFMVSKIVTEEGLTARGAWRPISGHWLLRK